MVFRKADGFQDRRVSVPCGQCIGCRLDYRHSWAVRCVHEAALHADNCFITLTYDEDHVPDGGTLVKADFQKFMKRLRKEVGKVRYFMCGEYGDRSARPHYHALLFGVDFRDKRVWSRRGGNKVFRSETLERLWNAGMSEIGSVSYQSAGYVAQYAVKKLKTKNKEVYDAYYGGRIAEYAAMSRRPGIGAEWFQRYKDELLEHGSVIVDGRESKVPRFYVERMRVEDPARVAALGRAKAKMIAYEDTSDVRLDVKRRVLESRLDQFSKRSV